MSHDHITATSDRNEFPEYMLDKNQMESPANLALFNAALNNDLPGVHRAIADGGKVDFFHRKDDSKNALHVSAEGGYLHIVDTLIKHGAHTNAVAVSGHDTPLTLCCHKGHVQVAQMLLDNGADVNTGCYFSFHFNLTFIMFVFSFPLISGNGYGNTPLHEACHTSGSIELVRLLVSRGADVNSENHKGSTPMIFLCYGEDTRMQTLDMARELIAAGTNVNHRDHRGMTPILVCCSSGRSDLIESLVAAGGDVTARDNENRSANAIALFYNQEGIAKQFAESNRK